MEGVRTHHQKVLGLHNGQSALALIVSCLSTNKAVHSLRLNGDILAQDTLQKYDDMLKEALSGILDCEIDNDVWEQSTQPLNNGGLGLHQTQDTALPAFVASRLTAAPMMETTMSEMAAVGFDVAGLREAYQQRTRRAETSLGGTLARNPALQEGLTRLCAQIRFSAHTRWLQYCGVQQQFNLEEDEEGSGAAEMLTAATEWEGPIPAGPAAQRAIVHHCAALRRNDLLQRWLAEGKDEDVTRLKHLTAEGQSHAWIYHIHGSRNSALSPNEWITAIRIRQGCTISNTREPIECAVCGQVVSDMGAHASCCATGECTRGHNRLRDALLLCLREVDAGAATEVPGLAPSEPTLRPADILSRATARVGEAAIDVSITSPHALYNGENPQQEARQRKMRKYRSIQGELLAEGITYTPLVWSHYGAPHPEVSHALGVAAERAGRFPRIGNPRGALKRWQGTLAVEIWRRAARMTQRCTRPLADPERTFEQYRDGDEEGDEAVYGEEAGVARET